MDRINIKEVKTRIRAEYKEKRRNIPPDEKTSLDRAVCTRFLGLSSYRFADTVLLYSPLKHEIDTSAIALDALAKGKKVAYPRCMDGNRMVYHYVTTLDELTEGMYGIKEPDTSLPLYTPDSKMHTVCVLPAIVYDKDGYRLGYGKGYYDRFLSGFRGTKAGLIYSGFIIDSVPRGRFDMPSDIIITEKGVVSFAKN